MKVNEGQWWSMRMRWCQWCLYSWSLWKRGCFGLVGWPSSTKVDQEVSSRARQTLETSTGRATGPPERWSPKVRWKMEVCCTRGGHHFDKWSEMTGCIWYGYIRPLILRSPGEGMTLTGGRVENDRRVLEGFALLGDVYIYIIYTYDFLGKLRHPRETEHTFCSWETHNVGSLAHSYTFQRLTVIVSGLFKAGNL